MIKRLLLDCTISLLKILIKQYEEGYININDLFTNTECKKSFLIDHISDIENPEDKSTAEFLLGKLENIHNNCLAALSCSERDRNANTAS